MIQPNTEVLHFVQDDGVKQKATAMSTVLTGLQYLMAVLVGLVIAFFPTGLVSYLVLPPDGPIGEGLIIMLIHLISCGVCIPSYIALMALHRQGRRDTRRLIACEILLRASVIVAACFICSMAIKLPTRMVTKWIASLAVVPAAAWAINSTSWDRNRDRTIASASVQP